MWRRPRSCVAPTALKCNERSDESSRISVRPDFAQTGPRLIKRERALEEKLGSLVVPGVDVGVMLESLGPVRLGSVEGVITIV